MVDVTMKFCKYYKKDRIMYRKKFVEGTICVDRILLRSVGFISEVARTSLIFLA